MKQVMLIVLILSLAAAVQADYTLNGPVDAMTNGWMNGTGLPNGNYATANLRTGFTGSDTGGNKKAILQTNLNWTTAGTREANTYWETPANSYAPGAVLTFNYAVISNDLSSKGYNCVAFIKELSAGWGAVQTRTTDLAVLGDGTVSLTVQVGAYVQFGFWVSGPADTAGSATADLAVVVGQKGSAVDSYAATASKPSGDEFANPATTTELTWVNPSNPPALTSIYFVESATAFDPNNLNPGSAKAALDAQTPAYDFCADQCTSSGVSLTEGKYYAWRVVCDANSSTDWTFHTINTAPTAVAAAEKNAWLTGSGTVDVTLDGSASTDADGYPGNPLTYTWTGVSGPSGAVDPADEESPVVTLNAAGTYVFQLVASDGLDVSAVDQVTVVVYANGDDHLVAHWKFEDNLNATVGSGIDGTAGGTGAIAYTTGVAGVCKALDLNGTNWVEIVGSNTLDFLGIDKEITISAWVRGTTFGTSFRGIVTKGDSAWRIATGSTATNAEFACGYYSDPNFVSISSTQLINGGVWHHVVGVNDGVKVRLYVDGVLDAVADTTQTHVTKNTYAVRIGGNSQANGPINADIDDVRIFDRGLSSAMILALYPGPIIPPLCGQNYAVSDLNQDCKTDVADFELFVAQWLDCTDLTDVNCGN